MFIKSAVLSGLFRADERESALCSAWPNSNASTWKRACLAENDHAVVTSDVALHQDLETLETSQAIT